MKLRIFILYRAKKWDPGRITCVRTRVKRWNLLKSGWILFTCSGTFAGSRGSWGKQSLIKISHLLVQDSLVGLNIFWLFDYFIDWVREKVFTLNCRWRDPLRSYKVYKLRFLFFQFRRLFLFAFFWTIHFLSRNCSWFKLLNWNRKGGTCFRLGIPLSSWTYLCLFDGGFFVLG